MTNQRVEAATEAFNSNPEYDHWDTRDDKERAFAMFLDGWRAALTAAASTPVEGEGLMERFPAGAIHNGRAHDDAGDADEFRKCFDYLAEWATEAAATIERLTLEIETLNAIFDKQWERDMEAVAEWRGKDVNRQLTLPDRGSLMLHVLDRALAAERERDEALNNLDLTNDLYEKAKRAAVEYQRQRDEAREALRAFAEAADSADDPDTPDSANAWESGLAMAVTFGDFRRARTITGE